MLKMIHNKYLFFAPLLLLLLFSSESILAADGDEDDPLKVLGENSWLRLRPGWSVTVNDQCLYEFVFQFEHDPSLPIGDDAFQGTCGFGSANEAPPTAPDGKRYLDPRQMWERFPDYVWATIGFNHLSVDWFPCGHRPNGYATAHYDFSFFRVTPEFRAEKMTCDILDDSGVIVPGEQICDYNQDKPNGMNFYIVPGAMVDRNPVVNMPYQFKRPELQNSAIPHYGLRSWDQDNNPLQVSDWVDIPIFMSTFAGDLVMWQAHVPYTMVSGSEDQFHSKTERYFETTVQTLPDTWAADYDQSDNMIRFIMVGRAGLCRGDFERAQEAAGGAPVFPNYDDLFALLNEQNKTANETSTDAQISGATISNPLSATIQTLVLGFVCIIFCW